MDAVIFESEHSEALSVTGRALLAALGRGGGDDDAHPAPNAAPNTAPHTAPMHDVSLPPPPPPPPPQQQQQQTGRRPQTERQTDEAQPPPPPPLQTPQLLLATAHLSPSHTAALQRHLPEAQVARVHQRSSAGGGRGTLAPSLRQAFHYFRGDKQACSL